MSRNNGFRLPTEASDPNYFCFDPAFLLVSTRLRFKAGLEISSREGTLPDGKRTWLCQEIKGPSSHKVSAFQSTLNRL